MIFTVSDVSLYIDHVFQIIVVEVLQFYGNCLCHIYFWYVRCECHYWLTNLIWMKEDLIWRNLLSLWCSCIRIRKMHTYFNSVVQIWNFQMLLVICRFNHQVSQSNDHSANYIVFALKFWSFHVLLLLYNMYFGQIPKTVVFRWYVIWILSNFFLTSWIIP